MHENFVDDYKELLSKIDRLSHLKDDLVVLAEYDKAAQLRDQIDRLKEDKKSVKAAFKIEPFMNEVSKEMDGFLNFQEQTQKEKTNCLAHAEDLYDSLRKIISMTDPDSPGVYESGTSRMPD
ncbi:hypothetical protein LCGC14_3133050, partial [marine sediment metagenome]